MGVIDFLKNIKGNNALKKSNLQDADLYNRLVNSYDDVEAPTEPMAKVEPLQIGEDGKIDYNKTLELKQNTTPRTLSEHLLGRTMTMDEQIVNPKTGETELKTYSNYKPGFLNNFDAGLRENYNNDFKIDNLTPGKKDFSYRLGEGIGSIVKALGGVAGDAYVAGTEGLKPALERQGYRTSDKLYKQALQKLGVDTNGINGYVGDAAFAKLVDANIAQENAAYRRMYYDQQNQNQKDMMQWRIRQAEAEQRQRQFENYLKSKGLDLEYAKFKAGLGKPQNGVANLAAVSNQLSRFEKSFKNMPGKLESNTLGRLRNATGFQTEKEANFNSQRTLLFNKIARDLGGEKGVLSDQDIKRIEKALPDYTDSYEQKQAKMQAIYDLLEDRLNAEGLTLSTNKNNDPLGIR